MVHSVVSVKAHSGRKDHIYSSEEGNILITCCQKMGSKTCSYILQTIRQLQSCSHVAGMTFPKFTRNHTLEFALPLLSHCSLKSAISSANAPIRCLCYETPCAKANNTSDLPDKSKNNPSSSMHVNHAGPLKDENNLKLDHGNSSRKSSILIALNKCTSPIEVLEAFSVPSYRKDEIFVGVQKLGHTFMELNEMQKCAIRDFIIEHPNLQHLTHGVLKVASTFSPGALVYMLNVFVNVKVNDQANLIKTLLLRCQEEISSLSEKEIVLLAKTLELLKSNKDVEMVKSSVRLLLTVKIEAATEVKPLLHMMKALGRNASIKTKFKFQDKALQMFGSFDIAQSEYLFQILADIGFFSGLLLDACSQKFIENIHELSYSKLVNILASCSSLDYFNEQLLTVIGDHILKSISLLDASKVSVILRYFASLHFLHAPLLDRYAAIFMNNLNSVKVWHLTEAIQTYARLNYLPENRAQQFLEALKTSVKARLNSISPKKLLYTMFGLCVLGVFPDSAINKLLLHKHVFDEKENSILYHINTCFIIEKSPSKRQSLLCMKKITSSTVLDIERFHDEMKGFINNPDLYHHCVLIANTYYVDFVFGLDTQENKLVPVGYMQADNLQLNDNSNNIVRVAVLCCTPNAFAMGTLHPLGGLALKIRNLKALGFSVVLVPINRIMSMSKEKRAELIKKIIYEELSDDPNALKERWALEDLQESPLDI